MALAQPHRPLPPAWTLSPANAWMKIPIKWDPGADSVSPALRLVRDQLYDQLIGYRYPLTPDTALSAHQSATVGPGGTVLTESGQILSYMVDPPRLFRAAIQDLSLGARI